MLISSQTTFCLENTMEAFKNKVTNARKNVARKSTSNRPLKATNNHAFTVLPDNCALITANEKNELSKLSCITPNVLGKNVSTVEKGPNTFANVTTISSQSNLDYVELIKSMLSNDSCPDADDEEECDEVEGVFSISASMLKYLKEAQLSPPSCYDSDDSVSVKGVLNYPSKYECPQLLEEEFTPRYADEFPYSGSDSELPESESVNVNLSKGSENTPIPNFGNDKNFACKKDKETVDKSICEGSEVVSDNKTTNLTIANEDGIHLTESNTNEDCQISDGSLKIEFITSLVDNDLWNTEVEDFTENQSSVDKSVHDGNLVDKSNTRDFPVNLTRNKSKLNKRKTNEKPGCKSQKRKKSIGAKLGEKLPDNSLIISGPICNGKMTRARRKTQTMKSNVRPPIKRARPFKKRKSKANLNLSEKVSDNSDVSNDSTSMSFDKQTEMISEKSVVVDDKDNKKIEKKKIDINEGVLLHLEAAKKTSIMRDGKLLKDKKELVKDIESTIEKNLPVVVDKEFDIQQSLTEEILLDQALRLAHQRTSPRRRPLLTSSQAKTLVKALTSRSKTRSSSVDCGISNSESAGQRMSVSDGDSTDADSSYSREFISSNKEDNSHTLTEGKLNSTNTNLPKNKKKKSSLKKRRKLKTVKSILKTVSSITHSNSVNSKTEYKIENASGSSDTQCTENTDSDAFANNAKTNNQKGTLNPSQSTAETASEGSSLPLAGSNLNGNDEPVPLIILIKNQKKAFLRSKSPKVSKSASGKNENQVISLPENKVAVEEVPVEVKRMVFDTSCTSDTLVIDDRIDSVEYSSKEPESQNGYSKPPQTELGKSQEPDSYDGSCKSPQMILEIPKQPKSHDGSCKSPQTELGKSKEPQSHDSFCKSSQMSSENSEEPSSHDVSSKSPQVLLEKSKDTASNNGSCKPPQMQLEKISKEPESNDSCESPQIQLEKNEESSGKFHEEKSSTSPANIEDSSEKVSAATFLEKSVDHDIIEITDMDIESPATPPTNESMKNDFLEKELHPTKLGSSQIPFLDGSDSQVSEATQNNFSESSLLSIINDADNINTSFIPSSGILSSTPLSSNLPANYFPSGHSLVTTVTSRTPCVSGPPPLTVPGTFTNAYSAPSTSCTTNILQPGQHFPALSSYPSSNVVINPADPYQSFITSTPMTYTTVTNSGSFISSSAYTSPSLIHATQQSSTSQSTALVNSSFSEPQVPYFQQSQPNLQYTTTPAAHSHSSFSPSDSLQLSPSAVSSSTETRNLESPAVNQVNPKTKKVVDVPLSILARDPRLRRKNVRVILDDLEFNTPATKLDTSNSLNQFSKTNVNTNSAPPLTKLPEIHADQSISNSEGENVDIPPGTSDETDIPDVTNEAEPVHAMPDSPKKKIKKKEIDKELLYKTPLCDLHEESSERSSYSRKPQRKPTRFDKPRLNEVSNEQGRHEFQKHHDTSRDYYSKSSSYRLFNQATNSSEGSEYPPALPAAFRRPSTAREDNRRNEESSQQLRRVDHPSRRRSEEYSEGKWGRDYADRRPLLEQSHERTNVRHRDYSPEPYAKTHTDYKHRRKSDYPRYDYAHKKIDGKFPPLGSSDSVTNDCLGNVWEDDNEVRDLLEGPVDSSRPFYWRRNFSRGPKHYKGSHHLDGEGTEADLFERRWEGNEDERRYRKSYRDRSPPYEHRRLSKRYDELHGPGRGPDNLESPMSPDQDPIAYKEPTKYLHIPQ